MSAVKPEQEEKADVKVDVKVAGFVPQILSNEILKDIKRLNISKWGSARPVPEAATEELATAEDPRKKTNSRGESKDEQARNAELAKRKADIKNWIRDGFEESVALVARSEREEIDMNFTGRFNFAADDKNHLKIGRTREELVSYALKFVGNPYVYGGTSLTKGTDCSGFTMSVFKQFGITLPRTSRDQALGGRETTFDKMKPGDLLFYTRGNVVGHVAMYIGNGKVVHASTKKTGIKISNYDYRKPYKVVSYLN
ncbi:MAG: C40 family peptidase [Fusobacteriaceae bacterium]|nr:C40 family peptidase [Fusobacteriaceae bacterium]